jgi:hypothetical protein
MRCCRTCDDRPTQRPSATAYIRLHLRLDTVTGQLRFVRHIPDAASRCSAAATGRVVSQSWLMRGFVAAVEPARLRPTAQQSSVR